MISNQMSIFFMKSTILKIIEPQLAPRKMICVRFWSLFKCSLCVVADPSFDRGPPPIAPLIYMQNMLTQATWGGVEANDML